MYWNYRELTLGYRVVSSVERFTFLCPLFGESTVRGAAVLHSASHTAVHWLVALLQEVNLFHAFIL